MMKKVSKKSELKKVTKQKKEQLKTSKDQLKASNKARSLSRGRSTVRNDTPSKRSQSPHPSARFSERSKTPSKQRPPGTTKSSSSSHGRVNSPLLSQVGATPRMGSKGKFAASKLRRNDSNVSGKWTNSTPTKSKGKFLSAKLKRNDSGLSVNTVNTVNTIKSNMSVRSSASQKRSGSNKFVRSQSNVSMKRSSPTKRLGEMRPSSPNKFERSQSNISMRRSTSMKRPSDMKRSNSTKSVKSGVTSDVAKSGKSGKNRKGKIKKDKSTKPVKIKRSSSNNSIVSHKSTASVCSTTSCRSILRKPQYQTSENASVSSSKNNRDSKSVSSQKSTRSGKSVSSKKRGGKNGHSSTASVSSRMSSTSSVKSKKRTGVGGGWASKTKSESPWAQGSSTSSKDNEQQAAGDNNISSSASTGSSSRTGRGSPQKGRSSRLSTNASSPIDNSFASDKSESFPQQSSPSRADNRAQEIRSTLIRTGSVKKDARKFVRGQSLRSVSKLKDYGYTMIEQDDAFKPALSEDLRSALRPNSKSPNPYEAMSRLFKSEDKSSKGGFVFPSNGPEFSSHALLMDSIDGRSDNIPSGGPHESNNETDGLKRIFKRVHSTTSNNERNSRRGTPESRVEYTGDTIEESDYFGSSDIRGGSTNDSQEDNIHLEILSNNSEQFSIQGITTSLLTSVYSIGEGVEQLMSNANYYSNMVSNGSITCAKH